MACDVTCEDLAAYAAGEHDPSRSADIERHLAGCQACRTRLDAIRAADAALAATAPCTPSAEAVLRTRRAIWNELRGPAAPANEIMTLDEAAAFLRVSPEELGEVVDDLPAFELAGQVRVRKARLIEWIEERERTYLRASVRSDVARASADYVA